MTEPAWGSDVMVDAMRAIGLPYVSLNPGSSYRGLHDSLVNYAGNEIEMICCPHEKIAVGVAHGYAKATGEPMGVILHNVVGLLHGTLGIYYASLDRVPVIVLGGSGPAAHDRRRPNIDWIPPARHPARTRLPRHGDRQAGPRFRHSRPLVRLARHRPHRRPIADQIRRPAGRLPRPHHSNPRPGRRRLPTPLNCYGTMPVRRRW